MGEMKTSLLKKLECLVCTKVVYSPVIQCKNHHLVCNACRKSLSGKCPREDCNEDVKDGTKSVMSERFLEKYVARCKYFKEEDGCRESFLQEDPGGKDMHELVCRFREVECLVPTCLKYVRLSELEAHFVNEHFMPQNQKTYIKIMTSEAILGKQCVNEVDADATYKSILGYMKVNDTIFLAIFRLRSIRHPTFSLSTTIHGYKPTHDANMSVYRCSIKVLSTENEISCYLWEGPIHQTYPISPNMAFTDDLSKLKWDVEIEIFEQ